MQPKTLMSYKCSSSAKISLSPGWLENFWHVSFVCFVSQFVFASRSTHRTKEISSPSPQKEPLLTSSSLTRSSIWLWWTSSAESSHCPSQRWEMHVQISEYLHSSRSGLFCQTHEPVLMRGKLYLFLFALQVSDYWVLVLWVFSAILTSNKADFSMNSPGVPHIAFALLENFYWVPALPGGCRGQTACPPSVFFRIISPKTSLSLIDWIGSASEHTADAPHHWRRLTTIYRP